MNLEAIIQTLGYPVAVSIALYFALGKLFDRYTSTVDKLVVLADSSNQALSANTTSNRKLVESVDSLSEKLGCRYPAVH